MPLRSLRFVLKFCIFVMLNNKFQDNWVVLLKPTNVDGEIILTRPERASGRV